MDMQRIKDTQFALTNHPLPSGRLISAREYHLNLGLDRLHVTIHSAKSSHHWMPWMPCQYYYRSLTLTCNTPKSGARFPLAHFSSLHQGQLKSPSVVLGGGNKEVCMLLHQNCGQQGAPMPTPGVHNTACREDRPWWNQHKQQRTYYNELLTAAPARAKTSKGRGIKSVFKYSGLHV